MKGRLIYTLGLPGSGKSTWAREYLQKLRDEGKEAIIIELDELRNEFGVSPDNRERSKFDALMKERLKRINTYLDNGYVVIISDTNLSPESKKEMHTFASQSNVERVTTKSFLHIPIEECIRRDDERRKKGQRFVGPDVIRKIANKYLGD